MYSSTVFALTQLIAEMRKCSRSVYSGLRAHIYTAYSLLCATAFFLLLYFGVGFPATASRSGYFFLVVSVLCEVVTRL